MKKLLLVLFSILIIAFSAVNVLAEEKAEGAVEALDIEFNAAGFTKHIDKMAIGMVGIFIVIGVVIVLTYLLNKLTRKKS